MERTGYALVVDYQFLKTGPMCYWMPTFGELEKVLEDCAAALTGTSISYSIFGLSYNDTEPSIIDHVR
jgi:hypothetical protein